MSIAVRIALQDVRKAQEAAAPANITCQQAGEIIRAAATRMSNKYAKVDAFDLAVACTQAIGASPTETMGIIKAAIAQEA